MVGQYSIIRKKEYGKMANEIYIGQSILETITVALYENPIIVFREYVQNSLDAYNKALADDMPKLRDFHVSIDIDEEKKNIVIRDNGYGIETNSQFRKEMLSIGSSDKTIDRTKYIGFRGIGRISGMPFCSKLIFRNKAQNSKKINECIWEGDTYRKKLDDEDTIADLEKIVRDIVKFKNKDVGDNTKKEDHFFEVTIENYDDEIENMLNGDSFKEKLIRMLPLKYHRDFSSAKVILDKYQSFMNKSIEEFMIKVKYNGKELFKSYNQDYILDSDIRFWEIRGKQKKTGAVGDKIGLLWFTFARHPKTVKSSEYYGILTRSKNVLMGDNDTFAQVADNNNFYITTFREMTQTMRCVYGELLINSPYLRDNSRRDWFLPDECSRTLNNIVTEFVKRIYEYRYCASKYFSTHKTKTKEELIKVLDDLVSLKEDRIDLDHFLRKEDKKPETKSTKMADTEKSFSEQDMPQEGKSTKKYYDIFMHIIKDFFAKEKKMATFLKLRAFIANHYKQI